ncbi:hypothetical protein D3C81_1942680 [compost metagenome]
MMMNQLCVRVEQGSADLQKAVLSLPVPLKNLMHSHQVELTHQRVHDKAGREGEGHENG